MAWLVVGYLEYGDSMPRVSRQKQVKPADPTRIRLQTSSE